MAAPAPRRRKALLSRSVCDLLRAYANQRQARPAGLEPATSGLEISAELQKTPENRALLETAQQMRSILDRLPLDVMDSLAEAMECWQRLADEDHADLLPYLLAAAGFSLGDQ